MSVQFLSLVAWSVATLWSASSAAAPAANGARGTVSASWVHLLLALSLLIACSRIVGAAFARLKQPAVIGEMLTGILLGPSVFGRFAKTGASFLLPQETRAQLGVVAELGMVLFLFLVGLELDPAALRSRARSAFAVSLSGLVIPLVLGGAMALKLHPLFSPPGVGRSTFVAFVAVAMSVTAFPVLARIVAERGLQRTELGVMALSCAAIDDAGAWCLLAAVVGLVRSSDGGGFGTIVLTAGYAAFMVLVARPSMRTLSARHEAASSLPSGTLSTMLALLLLSALTTEWIGIHAAFGAFVFGAVVPSGSVLAKRLIDALESLVLAVFLPPFFAFTGLRTDVGLLVDGRSWWVAGIVLVVAFAGKLGGVSLSARIIGLRWRQAAALGVLMNTRGLMEIIVLNVGLDLGIIPHQLFTILVLMALVTTIAAGPLLDLLGADEAELAALRSDSDAPAPGRPAPILGPFPG